MTLHKFIILCSCYGCLSTAAYLQANLDIDEQTRRLGGASSVDRHQNSLSAKFCRDSMPKPGMDGWKINTRPIPSLQTAKSVSDWDQKSHLPVQQNFEDGFIPCWANVNISVETPPLYRYKYLDGTWYSDWSHEPGRIPIPKSYKDHHELLVSALLTTSWLYKDFPNIEFVMDYSKKSHACSSHEAASIPHLKYSTLDISAVTVNRTYLHYNISQLLAVSSARAKRSYAETRGRDSSRGFDELTLLPAGQYSSFNRGFAIPTPVALKHFSMSVEQLQHYVNCTNHRLPWPRKHGVVFWRGSFSGVRTSAFPIDLVDAPRHHRAESSNSSEMHNVSWPSRYLDNKRMLMSVISHPYSFLDIGITDLGPFAKTLQDGEISVLQKPGLDVNEWGRSTVTVSVDGVGPSYQLPYQILGGSVTLLQRSPHVTWLEAYRRELWREGIHYESFDYDLSDFISKSREVVHRPRKQLQVMAEAAQKSGVELLNVFSMLDSIMWSLMRVKELSQWEVRPPSPGSVWKVVKMRKKIWGKLNPGMPTSVKTAIQQKFKKNFDDDDNTSFVSMITTGLGFDSDL
ncbi:hypothetical protein CEUSTIGMA_g4465.t1 [Chlamydomonas eustigma]|uniref:Glycosyl transferase CAP10 domain-containing protein n=1 Tax=Chlamydomonas eustigma TaxID=1157962 RepID=A0A250X1R6_9CHLO|nr:hypothetical protein CEUSTIGMA_g4465.t1 [Chlamydomonas eustigma]|eukprot:GAX77018.1 hypothetical protein CEUSTIGMA_g4465.t1 [Chlamydomonas eustigma]